MEYELYAHGTRLISGLHTAKSAYFLLAHVVMWVNNLSRWLEAVGTWSQAGSKTRERTPSLERRRRGVTLPAGSGETHTTGAVHRTVRVRVWEVEDVPFPSQQSWPLFPVDRLLSSCTSSLDTHTHTIIMNSPYHSLLKGENIAHWYWKLVNIWWVYIWTFLLQYQMLSTVYTWN